MSGKHQRWVARESGGQVATQVRFGVLGPVTVWRNEAVITPRAATQRAALGVLLLAEEQPLSADRLLTLLRSDKPPSSGRAWVSVVVSRLRSWLGSSAGGVATLEHRPHGYVLRVPEESLDLARFRSVYADALRSEGRRRLDLLEQALRLWRGPVLADLPGLAEQDALTVQIERLRLEAAYTLAEEVLACSEPGRAVPHLQVLTQEHPLDERLHALWSLVLAADGRQAEALEVIERIKGRLAEELGIDPGEDLREAQLRILRQQVQPAPAQSPPLLPVAHPRAWRGTRPQVSELIGRDVEQEDLAGLLQERRLVIVVGPGGCGKTTLAMQVADRTALRYADGVAVVEQASLGSTEEVVMALGSLMDASGSSADQARAAVERVLSGRQMLLVLDNCEHIAESCADIIRWLLGAAPGLTVLATSRQPLGLAEEVVQSLGMLQVPTAGAPVDETTPAVALFMRRAREALPSFALRDEELETVGQLCRRLDGLPLALELAASRVRALTVTQIAEHLDSSLTLLSGGGRTGDPRHRTLRAAIDWSYRLLDDDERMLLRSLAVFRGGFTLEAAEAVCSAGPRTRDVVLPTLVSLVDRFLVQPYEGVGGRRYRLLETVREFAGELLAAAGEATALADRHLDQWVAASHAVDGLPRFQERRAAWRRMADDMENVRAVLDHGFHGARAADAAEMTVHMFDFWLANRAYLGDGARRLRQAEEVQPECSPEARSLTRYWAAVLLAMQEDYAASRADMTEILPELDRYRPREHRDGMISLVTSGRFVLDPAVLDQAATLPDAVGDDDDASDEQSTALTAAGGVFATWGRYGQAAEMCERYAARAARRHTEFSISQQVLRTEIALGRGDHEEAETWARLLLEQLPTAGNPLEQEPASRAIGLFYLSTGRPGKAEEFLAQAEAELRRHYPPTLSRAAHLQVLLAEAQRRTGSATNARATLADALSRSVRRTHFRVGFTAVLASALIAADLGAVEASRDLAEQWDTRRRRIGLPAPIGLSQAAADTLGLDPAAPELPDPSYAWTARELREVVEHAHLWCVTAQAT